MRHPEEYPPLEPGEVSGRPTDDHLLRLYASRPAMGERAVAFLSAHGRGPTGATPVVEASVELRPRRGVVADGLAAAQISERSVLSVDEARAVVAVHGPDLHPARAVRLWRQMKENA